MTWLAIVAVAAVAVYAALVATAAHSAATEAHRRLDDVQGVTRCRLGH